MSGALSLRPGDRVPDFILPGLDGKLRKFVWSFTGKPVALVVADDLKTLDPQQFADFAGRCAAEEVEIVVAAMTPVASAAGPWSKLDRGVLLCDGERKFVPLMLAPVGGAVSFGQSGIGLRQRVIVLDANQRVAGSFDSRPLIAAAEQIASLANAVSSRGDAGLVVRAPAAPVLVLPRVFEAEFCAQVMRLWHKGDHKDSGVSSRYGNVGMQDLKRTEDYMVTEPMMQKAISDRIAYRIGPELVKVFAYDREFTFDAHVVLSYSAEGQHFFAAHRDNGAPTTADRSFAVSLNLNDDFEGGELVFPEYSSLKVSPRAGAAAVFSCSVLHAALPVTRGRRFVLTTFFRTKK